MPDILDDYRDWRDNYEQPLTWTHHDGCHMYHSPCMIHKLAAALEAARLTDKELDAIKVAASDYSDNAMDGDCWNLSATLRGLLKRLG